MSATAAPPARTTTMDRLIANARWFIEHAATERRLGHPGHAAAALKQAATARIRASKFRESR